MSRRRLRPASELNAIRALQHEEVVDDFAAIGVMRGRAPVRGLFEEPLGAFPDFRIRIVRLAATEDRAVVQWEATGRFAGTLPPGLRCERQGRHVARR